MKNNSVMKCCVCNNEKMGQFITIDNKKYHLCCIKQLKDNWNKLKDYLHNVDVVVDYSEKYDEHFINYDELIDKMQELEKGSDSND